MPVAYTGYGRIKYETLEELQEKLAELKRRHDEAYQSKILKSRVESDSDTQVQESEKERKPIIEEPSSEEVVTTAFEDTVSPPEDILQEEETTVVEETEQDTAADEGDTNKEEQGEEVVEEEGNEEIPFPDPNDRDAWVELAESLGIKTYRVKTSLLIKKVKEALKSSEVRK